MKKSILFTVLFLSATPVFSYPGISLENGITFNGNCGTTTIKGTAFSVGSYFTPSNVEISFQDKVIFNSDDHTLPIGIEHMSINCLGENEKQRLVIGANCMAHAPTCGKTWFYIVDTKTGELIAPGDIKSEASLCDANCAGKLIEGGFVQAIEEERYR